MIIREMKQVVIALCYVALALVPFKLSAGVVAWEWIGTQFFPVEFGLDYPDMFDVCGDMELLEFQARLLPDGSRSLVQYGGNYMEYQIRTALAALGDFADAKYFDEHDLLYDELFWVEGHEPKVMSILKQGESAFVAIQCEYSEITDGGNRVCYGFIEMSLDGAGDPIVLSAYREDEVNQGLYIFGSGPTPEPTSAMLVLFGLAALALRRRTCGLLSPVRNTLKRR